MTYPGGLKITYHERNKNGQVTGIKADEQVVTTSVSYLPFGPVSGMTFGNGLKTDRTHDKRYLLTQSETSSVADYQYVRDAAGNVLSVSGVGTPDAPSKGKTDSEHEGNRLMRSTGGKAASYAYDGHGNIVSDGTRTFVYNQNNRLAKVTQGETVLGEYSYDGQGRRVRKLASGVVTLYHYDHAGNLIAETDVNGNLLRAYIYLNGERVAMKIYGDQAGMYYFLNDHLGTPQKVVDSAGNVVWEAAYLPFGEAQIVTEIVANNFRFPGQYFDAETGLHHNWHRYYDPKTGRYFTPDPIGLAGGVNLYAYAGGNPTNLIDPEGTFFFFLIVSPAAYTGTMMLADAVIAIAVGEAAGQIYLESRKKGRKLIPVNPDGTFDEADTDTCDGPPPNDECHRAMKLLREYERLAQKYGVGLSIKRLGALNELRDAGMIKVTDLPKTLRKKFPARFKKDNLETINRKCGGQ